MDICKIAVREIVKQVLATIPAEVQENWRFIRPNKPQLLYRVVNGVKVEGDPAMTFSSDLTGIVMTSDRYVCTVCLDVPNAIIVESLYWSPKLKEDEQPPEKGTNLILYRGYPLDDPKSLDKASGFLVKIIRNYLCPFQKPILR